MDLHVIGKAWGMQWAKTLEYMHFLDPTTKDTVQLIQGSIERMDIPQSERRGLYKDEFDRLTEIGKQRKAAEEADRLARREKVDAEVERIQAENERYKQARLTPSRHGTTSSRPRKPSSKKSGLQYYAKVKTSRANRDA